MDENKGEVDLIDPTNIRTNCYDGGERCEVKSVQLIWGELR